MWKEGRKEKKELGWKSSNRRRYRMEEEQGLELQGWWCAAERGGGVLDSSDSVVVGAQALNVQP